MKNFLTAIIKGSPPPEPLLEFTYAEVGPDEDADFIEVWVRRHVLNQNKRQRVGTIELVRTDDHEPFSWMFFGLAGGYMHEEHLMEVAAKIRKLHNRDYT